MSAPTRRRLLPLAIALALAAPLPAAPVFAVTQPPADAQALLQAGQDVQRRLIELKNAVQANPEDPEPRLQLGRLYLDLGDGTAADKEFSRAIELGRDDYAVKLLRGRAWLLQRELRKPFLDHDLSQTRTAEDRAGLLVLQGQANLAEGKPADARAAFEQALTERPAYTPARLGLIEAALEENDLGAAELGLAQLTAVTDADPAEFARLKGNLAFKRERFTDAETAYREALAARPGAPVLLRGLATVLLRLERLDDASAILGQALALRPNDGDLLYLRAVVAYRTKDFETAAQLAGMLTAGNNPDALFIAGASSYFAGAPEQAKEYLARYLPQRPDDQIARRMLGELLLGAGDPAAAWPVLEPLGEAAGEDVGLLDLLGVTAVLAGANDAGVGFLERAVALEPDNAELSHHLATARLAAGDRPTALAELERLATSHAEWAGLDLWLAQTQLAGGDPAAALAAAGRFLDSQPDSADALTIQAIALLRQGDVPSAESAFKRVLELRPGDPDARTGLAEIKLRSGDAAGALREFEALYAGQSDNLVGQMNLATAELQAGREYQAVTRLENLVAAHPDNERARLALAYAHLLQYRPRDALTVLAAAGEAQSPATLVARARAELMQDRAQAAVALLEPANTGNAGRDLQLALIDAYERADQTEPARALLAALLAGSPADPDLRFAQIRQVLRRPDLDQATLRDTLTQAQAFVQQYPQDPRALLVSGFALLRFPDQADAAIEKFRQAHAALRGTDSAVALADALLLTGRPEEAARVLGDWTSAHPNDNFARVLHARALAANGAWREAADRLRRAAEQGATRPGLAALTAWTLAQAGDAPAAKPYLRQAQQEGADGPIPLHTEGLIALADGDPAGAVRLLQQAVAGGGGARMRIDLARAQIAAGQAGAARTTVEALLEGTLSARERSDAEALQAQLRR